MQHRSRDLTIYLFVFVSPAGDAAWNPSNRRPSVRYDTVPDASSVPLTEAVQFRLIRYSYQSARAAQVANTRLLRGLFRRFFLRRDERKRISQAFVVGGRIARASMPSLQ